MIKPNHLCDCSDFPCDCSFEIFFSFLSQDQKDFSGRVKIGHDLFGMYCSQMRINLVKK